MCYTTGTGAIGLIDVNALNGAARGNRSGVFVDGISRSGYCASLVNRFATYCVVENEDFGSPGSTCL